MEGLHKSLPHTGSALLEPMVYLASWCSISCTWEASPLSWLWAPLLPWALTTTSFPTKLEKSQVLFMQYLLFKHYTWCFICITSFNPHKNCEVGATVCSIFWMRKLRLKEVRWLTQGLTADRWYGCRCVSLSVKAIADTASGMADV